jgi:hypothetical protein
MSVSSLARVVSMCSMAAVRRSLIGHAPFSPTPTAAGSSIPTRYSRLTSSPWASATHKRPLCTDHLFGRQGHWLNRPAVTVQTPQRSGRDWQVRRQYQRLLVARVVDHPTPPWRQAGP